MSSEILEVMRQIERSRKVDREVLIQAIEAALVSASRKNYGAAQDIHVMFNPDNGDLVAMVRRQVVAEVQENWHEISLDDARKLNPRVQLGETVEEPMLPSDFGRIAAQTAKQVMVQRVRECERSAIFEEFKKRQGELINGVVLRQEHQNLIIDLGETEAVLPPREQTPRENFQNGDRIKAYVLDVRKTSRSPQVVISRSHPGLIRKLFEMEVPEVVDGVVEIKGVAREAGARSKVAVASRDKNVDPVGACVGVKGARIQSIVREIKGEKIDVIPYSENLDQFLKAALQPAKIAQVQVPSDDGPVTVIVKDDQLSLAIGKSGQNVRLASKLVNRKLEMLSETQYSELMRRKTEEAFLKTAPPLEKISGITEKMAERLRAAGLAHVSDFRQMTPEKLVEIPGIGQKTAEKILQAVGEYLPKPAEVKPVQTADQLFSGLGGAADFAAKKEKEYKAGDLFSRLDNAAAIESGDASPEESRNGSEAPASNESVAKDEGGEQA